MRKAIPSHRIEPAAKRTGGSVPLPVGSRPKGGEAVIVIEIRAPTTTHWTKESMLAARRSMADQNYWLFECVLAGLVENDQGREIQEADSGDRNGPDPDPGR
jgi:hypothetical protein